MTNNHINYIEFKAHDLEKIKAFYSQVFGWEFTDYGPTYTSFAESGIFGGFELSEEPILNGALIVLYHTDLESVQADVEKAGGEIIRSIFSFPGGRRFHFKDPSGNELAIWSDKYASVSAKCYLRPCRK
ncbi:VOC family protein [Lentiprolixibacter aurantiacus]|uniref:VOC family protein n=1 Tax=Lentiprolixibacter aurantiacus TaxID=2993939 RepID=A0AAE3MJ95_9FLAO|nr:VOC family protein [Lentiprolixibacter aurantiacus]MCX2718593.1 VOC family protein [Lentiprolixibacter aurantiacus]